MNKHEKWIRDFAAARGISPDGMLEAMKGPYLKDFVAPDEPWDGPWS